jgi:hypothetical protein
MVQIAQAGRAYQIQQLRILIFAHIKLAVGLGELAQDILAGNERGRRARQRFGIRLLLTLASAGARRRRLLCRLFACRLHRAIQFADTNMLALQLVQQPLVEHGVLLPPGRQFLDHGRGVRRMRIAEEKPFQPILRLACVTVNFRLDGIETVRAGQIVEIGVAFGALVAKVREGNLRLGNSGRCQCGHKTGIAGC